MQNVWPAFQSMCKPAENGNVERVTEVDAQWAAHPIPVCWARQCGDPCGASQYSPIISSLNVVVGENFEFRRDGGFGFCWEWRDAGVAGGRPVDSRNMLV